MTTKPLSTLEMTLRLHGFRPTDRIRPGCALGPRVGSVKLHRVDPLQSRWCAIALDRADENGHRPVTLLDPTRPQTGNVAIDLWNDLSFTLLAQLGLREQRRRRVPSTRSENSKHRGRLEINGQPVRDEKGRLTKTGRVGCLWAWVRHLGSEILKQFDAPNHQRYLALVVAEGRHPMSWKKPECARLERARAELLHLGNRIQGSTKRIQKFNITLLRNGGAAVEVDGKPQEVTFDRQRVLHAIARGQGKIVSGEDILNTTKTLGGDNSKGIERADRLVKHLNTQFPGLIESRKGTGGGYRLASI